MADEGEREPQNIEQGISNDEGAREENHRGRETQ
jgi:hypothetical protein